LKKARSAAAQTSFTNALLACISAWSKACFPIGTDALTSQNQTSVL
jgi:hypothetical protein